MTHIIVWIRTFFKTIVNPGLSNLLMILTILMLLWSCFMLAYVIIDSVAYFVSQRPVLLKLVPHKLRERDNIKPETPWVIITRQSAIIVILIVAQFVLEFFLGS